MYLMYFVNRNNDAVSVLVNVDPFFRLTHTFDGSEDASNRFTFVTKVFEHMHILHVVIELFETLASLEIFVDSLFVAVMFFITHCCIWSYFHVCLGIWCKFSDDALHKSRSQPVWRASSENLHQIP